MSERIYPAAAIDDRAEARIRAGHVWVYESDIKSLTAKPDNGGLCDVYSRRGRYLGTGFYNEASKIRVRMLSTNANDKFDAAFWERRVRWAVEYRRAEVRVATSDALEQTIVLGRGATRISSRELLLEMRQVRSTGVGSVVRAVKKSTVEEHLPPHIVEKLREICR